MSKKSSYSLLVLVLICLLSGLESKGQLFLTSDEIPECLDCLTSTPCGLDPKESFGIKQRHSYVSSVGFDYNRDGYSDQWLDIYTPTSVPPPEGFPVLVYAHAANQSAEDVCESAIAANSQGIVFISWESVNNDVRTSDNQLPSAQLAYSLGDGDFNRVLRWVRDEASVVTDTPLNLNHVIVSGSSRGARLSFKDLDGVLNLETGLPLVKAAVFSQAFPDLEKQYGEQYGVAQAKELVEPGYPPILFIYEENPGIIDDIHDPIHGIEVMEELRCQGVQSALVYNLDFPLFSLNTFEYILDFFYDPIGVMDAIDGQIVAATNAVSSRTLKAPKELELQIRPNYPTRFRFKWKQNGWGTVEDSPVRLDCEIRGVNENAESYCQSYLFQETYINDFSSNTETPENYRFPLNEFWDACDLPWYIEPGNSYTIQARCFIKVDSYTPVSTFTPWSESVTVTVPICSGLDSGLPKSTELDLVPIGPSHWSLDTFTEGLSTYDVFDLQGRRILNGQGPQFEIDLSDQPLGIYVLDVRTGTSVQRIKLSNLLN